MTFPHRLKDTYKETTPSKTFERSKKFYYGYLHGVKVRDHCYITVNFDYRILAVFYGLKNYDSHIM